MSTFYQLLKHELKKISRELLMLRIVETKLASAVPIRAKKILSLLKNRKKNVLINKQQAFFDTIYRNSLVKQFFYTSTGITANRRPVNVAMQTPTRNLIV